MGNSLSCLLTYAFKDKSISEIILNYKQNIVHVKWSAEHFSYRGINCWSHLYNCILHQLSYTYIISSESNALHSVVVITVHTIS